MRTAFHNTTDLSGQLLLDLEPKARSQEDMVIEVFRRIRRPMAYFEVGTFVEMNQCSLKRAITNLCGDRKTKAGVVTRRALLYRTKEKVIGPEGAECYRYALING